MANIYDQFDKEKPKAASQNIYDQFDAVEPQPEQPSFMQNMNADIAKRKKQADEIQANPNISDPSKYFQLYGNVGGGFVNDAIRNATKPMLDYYHNIPDEQMLWPLSTVRNVSNAVSPPVKEGIEKTGIGGYIADKYNAIKQDHPEMIGNVDAIGNLLNVGLMASPIRQGAEAIGTGIKEGIKSTAKMAVKVPLNAAIGTAKIADNVATSVGKSISNQAVQSNLPVELQGMNNADALFMRTLKNEGITPDIALKSAQDSISLGAKPSVAVTSNVPSMKELGFLMGRSSEGSKIAAKAIDDITGVQIPKLNRDIIKEATGGGIKSAEDYGQNVAKIANDSIKAQQTKLLNRAKPYYQEAVGVDKSVDIQNPLMQKVLQNPLAVKSLEDARLDPYTLTNVKNDLLEYGVDAGDLTKLPYNSTVSLHAARTHLRGLKDAAFRAGEGQKVKAINGALSDIDNAIESQFPSYRMGRAIYSEDAGALKTLKESPMGQMASMGEGDLSKVANNLMSKDPSYIKKFLFKIEQNGGDGTKMRQSLAGAYLKRKLEDSAKEGKNFSQTVFKNETTQGQLKAIIGSEKFAKIEKINKVIDELNQTTQMMQGSRTGAVNAIRELDGGMNIPTNTSGVLDMIKNRYTPSLVELVRQSPIDSARFNELLFTDKGMQLLQKLSTGQEMTKLDIEKISEFLRNPPKIKMMGKAEEILPNTQNVKTLIGK